VAGTEESAETGAEAAVGDADGVAVAGGGERKTRSGFP